MTSLRWIIHLRFNIADMVTSELLAFAMSDGRYILAGVILFTGALVSLAIDVNCGDLDQHP